MEKIFESFRFIIYAGKKPLLEKRNTCHNNLEKWLKVKVNEHTVCVYSLFTHCSFDSNKNKHDYCRGKGCIKKFYKDLKEHVMKINDFEGLKMLLLTEKENKSYYKQKLCYICKH